MVLALIASFEESSTEGKQGNAPRAGKQPPGYSFDADLSEAGGTPHSKLYLPVPGRTAASWVFVCISATARGGCLQLSTPPTMHPSFQYYCLTGLHLNYRHQTNLQSQILWRVSVNRITCNSQFSPSCTTTAPLTSAEEQKSHRQNNKGLGGIILFFPPRRKGKQKRHYLLIFLFRLFTSLCSGLWHFTVAADRGLPHFPTEGTAHASHSGKDHSPLGHSCPSLSSVGLSSAPVFVLIPILWQEQSGPSPSSVVQ